MKLLQNCIIINRHIQAQSYMNIGTQMQLEIAKNKNSANLHNPHVGRKRGSVEHGLTAMLRVGHILEGRGWQARRLHHVIASM